MISVHQLAEIISHSPKGTALSQISRWPGKERYRGLCPFHHEKTPSFDVFVGFDGDGWYYCQACQVSGSAARWLYKVEGKPYRRQKPDPELRREWERQKRREQILTEFRNRYPECSVPDDFIDV